MEISWVQALWYAEILTPSTPNPTFFASIFIIISEGVVSEVSSNTVIVIHYYAFGNLGEKVAALIREDPIEVFAGGNDGAVHKLDFTSRITKLMYGTPRSVCIISLFYLL